MGGSVEAAASKGLDLDPRVVHNKLVKAFGITYRLDVAGALGRRGLIPSSRFFDEPHNHNKGRPPEHWSDAVYLADYYVERNGVWHRVLVSFYDEGEGESSEHVHHKEKERYIIVKSNGGQSLLLNHAETIRLGEGEEFVVDPGTRHKFKKTGGPVLLIIDMEGAKPGTEAFQHDHGETPVYTLGV